MEPRIAIVGAGAVGGYVGANLAQAGHDVTLIDPWPAHVEAIRANGMNLYGMTEAERRTVRSPPAPDRSAGAGEAAPDRHRVHLGKVVRHHLGDAR